MLETLHEGFNEAIAEYSDRYPNDSFYLLSAIACHTENSDYQAALSLIDRLETAVGGDPYIELWRARIQIQQGNLDAAEKVARNRLALDPQDERAIRLMVSTNLRRRNFQRVAELLWKVHDELDLELGDLKEIPAYAEFVESPEYKAMLQRITDDNW